MRTVYLPELDSSELPSSPTAFGASTLTRALMERAAAAAADTPLTSLARHAVALLIEELRTAPDASPLLSLVLPEHRGAASFTAHVVEHPGSCTPTGELAGRFGMSAKTLSRRMFAETGLSAEAWRRRARLLEALSRLELGEPIARVASDVGYGSPSSFGTAFRRAFGMTPAQAGRKRRGSP